MAARNIILAVILVWASLSLRNMVFAQDSVPIPTDKNLVSAWFGKTVGQLLSDRESSLDPALLRAETAAPPRIINVKADGTGDFKTLTEAIKSIPEGNQNRVVIKLGPGNYTEKVTVPANKPFVTLYGDPNAMPVIVFHGTAREYGTVDCASLIVDSDYFIGANLVLVLRDRALARKEGQAVAMTIRGDRGVFYNTRFHGFQDTLCDDRGLHLFKDCYVEGTVDYIFGNGKSIYLNTEVHVVARDNGGWITAQGRNNSNQDTAYSFLHCTVTGSVGDNAFLGRAWRPYAKVVFAYSELTAVVNPAGWSNNNNPESEKTVFYGEFENQGRCALDSFRLLNGCFLYLNISFSFLFSFQFS